MAVRARGGGDPACASSADRAERHAASALLRARTRASSVAADDPRATYDALEQKCRAAMMRLGSLTMPMYAPSMIGGLRIERIGREASSTMGTLVVPGHARYGVVDADGRVVFEPPSSASLCWASRRLWSWRVTRREGGTGISRGDYVWHVDRFELDREGRGSLEWSYTLATSAEVGVASRLSFVDGTARRLLRLAYAAEDFPGAVYLVLREDGSVIEVLNDLSRARLLLRGAEPTRPAAPAAPPAAPQARSATSAALEALLSNPDDDDARLRYAEELGGARGELIRLSTQGLEPKRQREILRAHGEQWAAELGMTKSGLSWDRGFVVRGTVGAKYEPAALENPLWRLVRELPSNMSLPSPDLLDALTDLGCFNTASWLERRAKPWARLQRLIVRSAEIALLTRRPEHFPALSDVRVFVAHDETPPVQDLAPRSLARVELFGDLEPSTVVELLSRIDASRVTTLAIRRGQGGFGTTVLTTVSGAFRAVEADAKVDREWFFALLGALGRNDFDVVRHPHFAEADLGRWCRG